MKKIIIVIICLVIFINLTSCKKEFKAVEMSRETEQEIKEIYAEYYNSNNEETINSSDVIIKYYLGDYNGKKCAYVKDDISKDNLDQVIMPYCIIHPFYFKHIPETISVYYNGNYYTLKDAFSKSLFTVDELCQLSNYCEDARIYLTL